MDRDMERIDDLRHRLEGVFGGYNDVLGDFRSWLDENKIDAETHNGFPTEIAYKNVDRYIKETTIK